MPNLAADFPSDKDLQSDQIRLHITPFSPALLSVYVPPRLQTAATDISFHTVETFPDRPFGYVTMPKSDGEALKKKLHGSIIKGAKVRIEEAKPEKKKRKLEPEEGDVGLTEKKEAKKAKKSKKLKAGEIVTEGFELPPDRKVKRGWTEAPSEAKDKREKKSKDKKDKVEKKEKKREKSRYSKEPELLFRTTLPATAEPPAESAESEKKKKKDKKSRKAEREVIVHEFAKTKKHAAYLKSAAVDSSKKLAHEFVEGKGWVDEDGNVIEEVKSSRGRPGRKGKTGKPEKEKEAERNTPDDVDANAPDDEIPHLEINVEPPDELEPELDSSPMSAEPEKADGTPIESLEPKPQTPHPLESLFKKPLSIASNRPAPINTSFSFFGADEDNDNVNIEESREMEGSSAIPQTPFTQHVESRQRRARSMAPTPDTAGILKRFSFSRGAVDVDDISEEDEGEDGVDDSMAAARGKDDNEDEDEDEGDEANGLGIVGAGDMDDNEDGEESAFAKWFWENRGDNNRIWRQQRRDAMKQKRQRENKRLTRRAL